MANKKEMTEKKHVERELSQLMEATLRMEDELNSLIKN
jgi:hypothetical protein